MGAMPSPAPRRLLRRGLIAAVVVLVIVGGVVAYVLSHAPGNVSNPNVVFSQPSSTSTTSQPPAQPRKHHQLVDNFVWPWYGYDAGRTRFFASEPQLHPPLHLGWHYNDGALLEFPPVIYHETLFLLDDGGVAKAVNALNGHMIWQHKVGTLAAASPAIAPKDGVIVVPVLSVHGRHPGGGAVVALSMRNGHQEWGKPLPTGSESSPIVAGHTVYLGDDSGTMWALSLAHRGHVFWSYHASGAIKGGPALSNGVLYFGDYAGRAYAISSANGHQIWAVGTSGAHFGFGSGNFYATPAVAFGRVYMGNTDGRVYSFGISHGSLAWATGTGAYVYASASVADPPGLGPTVYVGSYSGYMYAFNARTGAVRWRHPAGGRISGSSTVIDNTVYFSNLGAKTTTGLNATTGRTDFRFPFGAFTPVIADYHAIYLVGYSTIYQMLPGPKPRPHQVRKPAKHHTTAPRRRRVVQRKKRRSR